jgi:hypothetical protein
VVPVPDLHITPLGWRLLKHVGNGHVWQDMSATDVDVPHVYWIRANTDTGRKEVTPQVSELVAAGLVREPRTINKGALPRLTAAGRRALEGGGRP